MISIVIPAYNEEERIGPTLDNLVAVLEDLQITDPDIIVVDDGSADRTFEIAQERAQGETGIRAVAQPVNQGMGQAILRGLELARHPRFMFVPGDNDMSLVTMRQLLALRDVADLVMAVPLNIEGRTVLRNVLSFIYRIIFMVGFGVRVNYINAASVYPTEKLRALGLKGRRFSLVGEANLKLLRSGLTYAEIPGYVKDPPERGRTVTLRNLMDVTKTFLRLVYEVKIKGTGGRGARSTRVFIDFSSTFRKTPRPLIIPEAEVFGEDDGAGAAETLPLSKTG